MPTLTKLYTMQEAAKHNTSDDCWVVVDGKVYDVTDYLDEHPGGDEVLLKATGKDATDEFEDAGHSKGAIELMQEYCIGELDPSEPVIPVADTSAKEPSKAVTSKFVDTASQYWAIPVAIVGVSVVVAGFFLWHKK
ncbi:hypothetical protein Sjap_023283 [Stephania japonica]|uniref:Cytochrome b5 heme-binding domain-containing protein n=1 Tax=Stephania japonica TaxID=461633 RepID=A0AAP0HMU0_9MAGN